ncbi:DUF6287 domain-containing protein [Enterococcus olivae]
MKNKFWLSIFVSMSLIVLVACSNEASEEVDSSTETIATEQSSTESVQSSASDESTESSSQEISSEESEEEPELVTVNESEILNNEYRSLNGTWTNSDGYQLVFEDGTVTVLNDDSNSQYSLVNPQKMSNVIYLSFDPAPAPNGMNLMIAMEGTTPEGTGPNGTDGTDSNFDRIIMGNNGGTLLFAPEADGGIPETAYYKDENQ